MGESRSERRKRRSGYRYDAYRAEKPVPLSWILLRRGNRLVLSENDILPWLFYGNALDDTTKTHERLEVVVLSGLAKAAISLGIIKVLETA